MELKSAASERTQLDWNKCSLRDRLDWSHWLDDKGQFDQREYSTEVIYCTHDTPGAVK